MDPFEKGIAQMVFSQNERFIILYLDPLGFFVLNAPLNEISYATSKMSAEELCQQMWAKYPT